jgi:nitrogen regulatory protein PII 2
MKEIIAIIRMNAIQKTKRAFADAGFPSVTVKLVFGRGKTKRTAYISSNQYQPGG